jgi:hypothetical protein
MRQRAAAVVIGVPDFNALHSGKHNENEKVQFCAFDMLALDGDDYLDRLFAPPPLTGPIAWAELGQPRTASARSHRSR